MTILLSSLLISFVSIAVMFGRKLSLIRNGGRAAAHHDTIDIDRPLHIPLVAEIKDLATRKTKRFAYLSLVATIRIYFRTSNMVKAKHEVLKAKIKSIESHPILSGAPRREVNAFLKVVSDYKHKLRKIKHRIKEEEKIL